MDAEVTVAYMREKRDDIEELLQARVRASFPASDSVFRIVVGGQPCASLLSVLCFCAQKYV